jgi:hypothetical protein
MSEELHETLCVLFIEIQKPWAALSAIPHELNYTYTLYQLCVLLGQSQYLPYIATERSGKTEGAGPNMEKVCNDLGWKFFPPSNV